MHAPLVQRRVVSNHGRAGHAARWAVRRQARHAHAGRHAHAYARVARRALRRLFSHAGCAARLVLGLCTEPSRAAQRNARNC
eukprot:356704-Chlamydomonas_euryale.AAC.10